MLREEPLPGDKVRQVFEIWTKGAECLTHRIVLPEKLHGNVINQPNGMGSLSWRPDETAVVYGAERLDPETVSYFETNSEQREEKKIGAQNVLGYGKTERWGEKYTKMAGLLDLFLLNIKSGAIAKIENVPTEKSNEESTLDGYCLGQASFSPCGTHVVYTAWDAGAGGEMPRRLGMIYCYNRPSKIYASPIKKLMVNLASPGESRPSSILMSTTDGNCVCLTKAIRISRSPRFSPPKGTVASLCYLASDKGFDTHDSAMSLHALNWDTKGGRPLVDTTRVLVKSTVDAEKPDDPTTVRVANLCFPGIYTGELPLRCCTKEHIYTTTKWGSVQKVIRISLDKGEVSLVNVDIIRSSGQSSESLASQQLMCIDMEGGAILTESAPNRPAILGYVSPRSLDRKNVSRKVEGTLVAEMGPISASAFTPTPERDVLGFLNYNYEVFLMSTPTPEGTEDEVEIPVQWVFLKPPRRDSGLPPLIVVPHGGPHSCTSTVYMPSYAFLCAKGYAILHVNYRGSTGFGQRALESLPGNVGKFDVKDVVDAVETITGSGWVDKNRVGICGGSHGGFLASHCIGQYPNIFKVAAMRNPVTNIATMTTATDIVDWCFVEAVGCGYYNPRKFRGATADELKTMWDASPIRHADRVAAPTLIALGMSDQRVPPSQGLEFYHTLRSNGVKTKLLVYEDDDHPIDQVKSEVDLWMSIKGWFDEHL